MKFWNKYVCNTSVYVTVKAEDWKIVQCVKQVDQIVIMYNIIFKYAFWQY
jgi:hypothetical protein